VRPATGLAVADGGTGCEGLGIPAEADSGNTSAATTFGFRALMERAEDGSLPDGISGAWANLVPGVFAKSGTRSPAPCQSTGTRALAASRGEFFPAWASILLFSLPCPTGTPAPQDRIDGDPIERSSNLAGSGD
jgi:hypothetical protein